MFFVVFNCLVDIVLYCLVGASTFFSNFFAFVAFRVANAFVMSVIVYIDFLIVVNVLLMNDVVDVDVLCLLCLCLLLLCVVVGFVDVCIGFFVLIVFCVMLWMCVCGVCDWIGCLIVVCVCLWLYVCVVGVREVVCVIVCCFVVVCCFWWCWLWIECFVCVWLVV